MKQKNFLRLMALLLSLVFFSGCALQKVSQENETSSQEQEAKPEEEQTPPEPEPVEEASATLVAVGDNLLHNTISWDAQQGDGSYDFTPVYQPVKDLIQSADIAFLNQEVPLNGTVGRYPSLDAPQQAADAIVDCGFDIVNEASNHSLDKGIDGHPQRLEEPEYAGDRRFFHTGRGGPALYSGTERYHLRLFGLYIRHQRHPHPGREGIRHFPH